MQFITPELEEYCINHTQDLPDYLHELERTTNLKTLAPQMLSGPLMGRFLSMMSHLLQPSCIVEIGTFTGYSSLCLAEGLAPDGHIHTFEINREMEPIIREGFGQSPYADRITLHLGAAEDIYPGLHLSPNMAFIDAGKMSYRLHYDMLMNTMQSGSVIIADNVLWSGKVLHIDPDEETQAIKDFNEYVLHDPRTSTVMLPIRDGVTLIRIA